MNCYGNLTALKARMTGISGTTHDAVLLTLLNTASRKIDKHCDRFFYVKTATQYFDGTDSPLMVPDLLSVTSIKLDDDQDRTYSETMTVDTDYDLLPYNKFPKTEIQISSNTDRNYDSFQTGMAKGVQIIGSWGYGDGESATPYYDSGATVAEAVDATETDIDIALYSSLSAGMTILIDSEQMYVESTTDDTQDYFTVKRGVNGTTTATHDTASEIYIYQYPDMVVEAAYSYAARVYKLSMTSYTGIQTSTEFGDTRIWGGLSHHEQEMLTNFVRVEAL